MQRLLLHVCCGPCSTHVINELKTKYRLTLYFYNPNIYPEEEYQRRLAAARQVAQYQAIDLAEGEYNEASWEQFVQKCRDESEGGKRCELCMEYRLKETSELASEMGFDFFATTLTIGPNKRASVVNRIGTKVEKRAKFLAADWKKRDGHLKSIHLSKEANLYRQNYCGCKYSLRPAG